MSRLASSEPATKTLSPQTIGELVPTFGIGFFHRMFSPFTPSHFNGALSCAAMPLPPGPRKDGQEWSGSGSAFAVPAPAGAASAGLVSAGLVSAELPAAAPTEAGFSASAGGGAIGRAH